MKKYIFLTIMILISSFVFAQYGPLDYNVPYEIGWNLIPQPVFEDHASNIHFTTAYFGDNIQNNDWVDVNDKPKIDILVNYISNTRPDYLYTLQHGLVFVYSTGSGTLTGTAQAPMFSFTPIMGYSPNFFYVSDELIGYSLRDVSQKCNIDHSFVLGWDSRKQDWVFMPDGYVFTRGDAGASFIFFNDGSECYFEIL
ncbi:hypothetical protein ACFLZN_01015, partial [Nanoarchaeota archaeon]